MKCNITENVTVVKLIPAKKQNSKQDMKKVITNSDHVLRCHIARGETERYFNIETTRYGLA